MNTDNYLAWPNLLTQRDTALYWLLLLAAGLVGSYLLTYAAWIPGAWGKRLRIAYEIGGVLFYLGVIVISI